MWQILTDDLQLKIMEEGLEVIGYNPNWIDEDYNPSGFRICCIPVHDKENIEWVSAAYCSYHDLYEHRGHDYEHSTDEGYKAQEHLFKPRMIMFIPKLS